VDSCLFYWEKSAELFSEYHPDHADYSTSLNNLGILYKNLGDYAKAEEYYLQALAIQKKVLGEEHADYARSLNNLGILYSDLGDYAKAEEYYLKSLAIRKKVLGEEHADYARSLNNLGVLYKDLGDYAKAEEYYLQSLAIYKKILGEEHADYARSLNNLGTLYKNLGDYAKAEEYYLKSLAKFKKVLGEEHVSYAMSLNNLGLLYSDLGDYAKAEEYYLKSLAIIKKVLGEEHPDYAMSLHNLGGLYKDLGDYAKAEEFYLKSLAIRKKVLGEEHVSYAMSLNNLGILYYDLGDYAKTEEYYLQSLAKFKKVLGEEHATYAKSLNNLGVLYRDLGDYAKAEEYCLQSLAIRKKVLGEEHADYAGSLNNLGTLYRDLGDYAKAEEYYLKSLAIKKKVLGEEHADYASSLHNLGGLYSDLGDYAKAEKYYLQSLAIKKKVLGEEHADFLRSQQNLALLRFRQEEYPESLGLLKEVYTKRSDAVIADFEWMSEALKEAYWSDRGDFFSGLAAYAHDAGELQGSFSALAYDATLFRKSRLLESTIDEQDYEANREKLKTAYDVQRRTLKKMHSEGGYDPQAHDILAARVDSLDKALQQSWPEYAALKRNLSINWQQVQRGLSDKEVAIEFVRFYHAKDSLSRYGALVIDARCSSPTYVPLCSEDDLEKIMSEKALYESGRDFYDLLWAPLEPSLQGVDIVYYAADGLLNQIPFHSIILSRKGEPITYAMDRYELHKLTSTRYLALELKAAAQQPPAHSIAMLGGMDYDYLPGQSKSRRKGSGNKAKERSSQYSGQPLIYLEGTMKEVQESAKQLKRQKTEYDVTTYTGVEAKEELLYEIDSIGVPGILHIATHGYAFPEMDFSDTTISEHSLRYVYRYSPYPMVRSGLIMTSGNWKWTGSDTLKTINPANEDGILTAMEVADLPLDECKLVVLSACESALGHIDEEEGTLGIVRGFKLAGVEQIMATLWSINDKKASEFMLAYYEHLAHNNNTIKAYQETQLLMRNKYPTNPQYWAGFVLVR
jgi:tetratricopeptide (TPR) repeat protein